MAVLAEILRSSGFLISAGILAYTDHFGQAGLEAQLTSTWAESTLLPMPVLLLTNDDGIQAPGLQALEGPLGDAGEVWVVAPNIGRSACGRAVSLHHPLRVHELGERRFAVDGTPSDCVLLAFRTLLPRPPEVVVSGINPGYNVGEDLDYSGTVGAAAEGALQGARVSMAISTDDGPSSAQLAWAADFAGLMVRRLLPRPLPPGCYLNVNFPRERSGKIRWTRQGNFLGTGEVETRVDPRGRKYYWIGGRPTEKDPPPDTDRGALMAGCVSASVLTLDRSFHGTWSPPALADDGYTEDAV